MIYHSLYLCVWANPDIAIKDLLTSPPMMRHFYLIRDPMINKMTYISVAEKTDAIANNTYISIREEMKNE